MPDTSAPAPRGRPPVPGIAEEAVEILEQNAFSALRGPRSRGAVPRNAFTHIDVSTVDRSVRREFPDGTGRTPFDLATRQVCNLSAGTQETLNAVFAAVEQSFRTTDDMSVTVRQFLRANFEEACRERGLLATVIVQAAACAHLEHAAPGTADQDHAATEVVRMRQTLIDQMIGNYVATLTIALRRLRRRPRAPFGLRDIVLAVIASSDGSVLLSKLDPALAPVDLVVEAQWTIIVGLTEPGLMDPPQGQHPDQRQLVEAAMEEFAAGRLPVAEELARRTGVPATAVAEVFADGSAETIAQGCMEFLVGSAVETEAIAIAVRGAELAAVRDLLIATTLQADATPLLAELVRDELDGGFCAAARRNIAAAIVQAAPREFDVTAADAIASMVIDAALRGTPGRATWEAGLEVVSRQG
jgi:hypothetical protein